MKATAKQITETEEMGLSHTAAFLEAVKDYQLKTEEENIPRDMLILMKKTFDRADIKNQTSFKGEQLAAYKSLSSWKSDILTQIVDGCHRYGVRTNSGSVPISVVENLVTLVNQKIQT